MIFELIISDISHVRNFEHVAHEAQLPPNGAIFGSLGGGGGTGVTVNKYSPEISTPGVLIS